jgi:hypothetical protein
MVDSINRLAGWRSTPIARSSSPMAPKMECALRSLSRPSSFSIGPSMRRLNRWVGLICPAMTACGTPNPRNAVQQGAQLAQVDPGHLIDQPLDLGSVSPLKATAHNRVTPCNRADRASTSG